LVKSKGASARKYGTKASKKVGRAMHEMKLGELRSGRSGKKVASRKQAVAIGLSEARREGAKAPPPPNRSAAPRKKATKRSPTKARPAPAARKPGARIASARSTAAQARG